MKKSILIILTVGILAVGCDREIPTPSGYPSKPELPNAPINLVITVADQALRLNWLPGDDSEIVRYRIYRGDSLNAVFTAIDSSSVNSYVDRNLLNGKLYYYQISAVDSAGRSGKRSAIAWGVPNLFSISINGGDSLTYNREVTLNMAAPEGCRYMMVANSSDFSGSNWESFAATKSWLLTSGAGIKTVYAMFRDAQGNATSEALSDNITLQTPAYQYTISAEDGAVYAYSRDINLTLSAPTGTSFMKISTNPNFAGAQWEPFSTSKNLHLDNHIANGEIAFFYARFRDQNQDSAAVQASDSIITAFADPVDLLEVIQPLDQYQTINLNWTPTRSEDFFSYRIYRRRGSAAVDTLISNITNATITSYTDSIGLTNLPDTITQPIYYMVRFISTYGDSSDSDTIRVNLKNTQPPTISCFINNINYVRDTVQHVTNLTATLGWSRSEIPDFADYMVFENTSPSSGSARPVSFIYDRGSLSYDIVKNNVDTTLVFYYWLKVRDLGGQQSQFSAPDSIRRR
jgi:hypothetical protein